MDDLIAFLRARLVEDERVARFAFADHNDAGPEWTEIWSGTVDTGDDHIATGDAGLSRHIERFDPARMLAEVAAKRQIVDRHQRQGRDLRYCATCMGRKDGYQEDWQEEQWPCETLRLLALPYAGHPDYREEFRP